MESTDLNILNGRYHIERQISHGEFGIRYLKIKDLQDDQKIV
jgi:hypothetical protein